MSEIAKKIMGGGKRLYKTTFTPSSYTRQITISNIGFKPTGFAFMRVSSGDISLAGLMCGDPENVIGTATSASPYTKKETWSSIIYGSDSLYLETVNDGYSLSSFNTNIEYAITIWGD